MIEREEVVAWVERLDSMSKMMLVGSFITWNFTIIMNARNAILATHLSQPLSLIWHQHLAQLITQANKAAFPELLVDCLKHVMSIPSVMISAHKGKHRPLLIYDDYPPHKRAHAVERYLKKTYLLDPFCLAIERQVEAGVYRLRELAPDRFHSSEYYQHYYELLQLDDEVGVLADVGGDVVIMVSLGFRQNEALLTRKGLSALKHIAPVIQVLLAEFWYWQSSLYLSSMDENAPVDAAFESFGRGVLTPREREIVHLLLAGHSAKSAAQALGISDGTVKVHRKNLYQRLNVSSQSQLFRLFLDHVALVSRRQDTRQDSVADE